MRVKNHIKSAVGNLSHHKGLSHDILSTMDFGQLCPVLAVPLLPRDKFNLRASCFSRVAPMIFPTYGHCELVTNFHTVQYSQLWKDFDLFVSGQRYNGSGLIHFPTITYNGLSTYFANENMSYKGDADNINYDIAVIPTTGSPEYRFLTPLGRYFRKLLNLLGYPFITNVYDNEAVYGSHDITFSALPLLAFLRVYVDYYESRQYTNTSVLREIVKGAFAGSSNVYWAEGNTIENVATLYLKSIEPIVGRIRLLFPSDYFTSAQAYPSLVGGSQGINIEANQTAFAGHPFYQFDNLVNDTEANYFVSTAVPDGSGESLVAQTSLMHRLIDNFENMIRRFNLVGSRDIDRIRSQFGVTPRVASNQYSKFVGGFSSELHIQDVTSTSAEPSVDNYLGSYAGKGILSNGDSFSIDSDDFGMLLGISFIKVTPLYSPGLNREVLKTSFFSYYNPDFDHGYSMAIALGELKTDKWAYSKPSDFLETFGYQNSYDEYRFIPSRVTGDFLDDDSLPWSFLRSKVGNVAQSDSLIYHNQPSRSDDGTPYNEFQRIFVDGSNRDHFYLYYNFDIDALRPVRTSSECFDLGVGNISTSNNPVI